MRDDDYAAFADATEMMFDVLGAGERSLPPSIVAMWFKLLSKYTLDEVMAGMEAHMLAPATGRTMPIPADIAGQIERMREADGRPGADEAWALALSSADEARTIVWTEEVAQAFDVARSVLAAGDKVGARMAFRAAYEPLVSEARAAKRPVRWMASEGHDQAGRLAAIERAIECGRVPVNLPALESLRALPDGRATPLLLTAEGSKGLTEDRRAMLAKLRDDFIASRAALANTTEADRARTEQLKAEAAERAALLEAGRANTPEAVRAALDAVMARPNRPTPPTPRNA